jgi:hypothetical protein
MTVHTRKQTIEIIEPRLFTFTVTESCTIIRPELKIDSAGQEGRAREENKLG